MKHLKLFKQIFETNSFELLVDQFDENFIDEYFRDSYGIDIEEAARYIDIWQFVDDDKFVSDYIQDEVNNFGVEDIGDKDNWKKYIKDNLIDIDSVKEYLNEKREERRKTELDLNLDDLDYDDLVDELKQKDLIKIIKDQNHETDYLQEYFEERYKNESAYDIMRELYSQDELQENGYKYIQNYVDDDKVIEEFYDNQDSSYMKEYVGDQISRDRELQTKLLKLKPKNALELFDIMEDDSSIGDSYEFQNIFMKQTIKQMKKEGEDDLFVAKKLKELNDKFSLANGIETKYKKYTFYIDTEKYNL